MSTQKSTRTRIGRASGLIGAVALLSLAATPASAETEVEEPDTFTSAFTATGDPGMVVNGEGESVPGPDGATGTFTYMVNSDEEIICYDITISGVDPQYESPAKTATHLHEAPAGTAGPARIAFPNPSGQGDTLNSSGCLQGPFTTGVEGDDGVDTGANFSLAELEDDTENYYSDVHTTDYLPGAVRGQLTQIPVGGVDTGFGGTVVNDEGTSTTALAAGAFALAGLSGAGLVLARRHGRG